MEIPKSSEQDKEFLRLVISDDPRVEVKPMFGNLAAFVNGNMFTGLFGSTIGVRPVDQASRDELAAIDGTGPFGLAGHPMSAYVALLQGWTEIPELVSQWVETALVQVGSLPPKPPKRAKK